MTTQLAPERVDPSADQPGGATAGPVDDRVAPAGPSAWQRARGRLRVEDPVISWSASIGVALLALLLRLWNLATPKMFEFDETYYAKDAFSMANNGYVRGYVEGADQQILAGKTTGLWTDGPSMIVHPEVGKWLIALGEKSFGMDPFGWRVASAVVGALMVLVMCRLARRVTGSTMLGLVAGVLLCFDSLQFVLSRLALLDIFLAFFILLAVTCQVCDRDAYRAKLGRLTGGRPVAEGFGPVKRMLFRPWLIAAGVAWGLAIGTKWTAVYPLAAFGLLTWAWGAGARRGFGVRLAVLRSVLTDAIPAFVSLVVVAGFVYLATWTGWLVHAHEYETNLSSTQYRQYTGQGHCGGTDNHDYIADNLDPSRKWPTADAPDASGPAELVQSLESLYYYHQDVLTFHEKFLNCSTHPYQSKPLAWPLLNRPVGVAAETAIQPGAQGCDAPAGSDCIKQVLLIGTPVLWWGGIAALLFALVMWLGARDWRYGLAIVGMTSSWLPWIRYDDRPIFYFYAVTFVPFIVLAVILLMGHVIGRSRAPSRRRTVGVVLSGAFVVLVVLNFAWFWPILTDELLTKSEWLHRVWFTRWI